MNDEELKQLWREQPLREPAPSAAQLISAMQTRTTLLRRCLDARDFRELVACAVVIVIFGYYFYTEHAPLVRLGWLIVIASSMFVAWKLVHSRRKTPPAPPAASTIASLQAELAAVRAQSRLLGSVQWWYLLPGLIGPLVATWSMRIDLFAKICCTLVFVAVDLVIYWLNQWARAKQLVPLEAELESLLHSAETGEPLDETQLADLRPIVLSMAAADQVKPIEFKVAFWQIALWGEIGCIGIWLVLLLGSFLDNPGGKTEDDPPEAPTRIVRAEAEERHLAVARKVVDLVNAGDYAAVQKLYNLDMSKAFPPQETSDFYADLAARYGAIETIDGPTGNGYRGWIAYRLHCQRGELTMSLVLDADDNIAGIYFQPAALPGVFNWRHPLWIVPFFLAGLLYSWALQKTTERAVGISSLGVHLKKGQDLILWDEIEEVRPLRVLNIRSLWLIRQSGEKTIMPWTSLERHSELKAAVEGFAPANHPIRSWLSLLKRA
jgi:hypothetical protein